MVSPDEGETDGRRAGHLTEPESLRPFVNVPDEALAGTSVDAG
jgi:hypothetical protein